MAPQKNILTPNVSAGKRNKVTYRDMILCAIKQLHSRGSITSFNAISNFLNETYFVRNDFILEKELCQLQKSRVLSKNGNSYRIDKLILSKNVKRLSKRYKKKKKRRSRIKRSLKRRTKLKRRKLIKRKRKSRRRFRRNQRRRPRRRRNKARKTKRIC